MLYLSWRSFLLLTVASVHAIQGIQGILKMGPGKRMVIRHCEVELALRCFVAFDLELRLAQHRCAGRFMSRDGRRRHHAEGSRG